jgi:ATP-binding cassette subfamily F protein 3
LDLAGKEVLEDALSQYPGAVVVVTHDRSLMAKLATRVLEVNDGRVVLYPGGYDDYESTRLSRVAEASEPPARVTAPAPRGAPSQPAAAKPKPAGAPTAARPDRATQNAGRKRERELARVEADIAAREARVKELEALLADPDLYHDVQRSKDIVAEYERTRAEIESLWERVAELG